MRTSILLSRLAVLLLSAGLLATQATAQNETTRSLTIRDGQVHIDGRLIPQNQLPASLATDGIQVQYTFSGDVRPVIDVNGEFFVVERDGLRPAEQSERHRASVTLGQGRAPNGQSGRGFSFVIGDEDEDFSSFTAPHVAGVGRQARALAAQAMRFQELQSRLERGIDGQDLQELTHAAEHLSRKAEEAALAAEALPRLELQSYLAGIQKHDQELFDLLLKEREIEQETIHLSREIRGMADGAERDARVDDLRRKLDEAFELKQTNRRREIQQLEARLVELQEKLEERERMRGEIIDNRLRQLLRLDNEYKW